VISWQIAPLALRGILLALSAIAFTVGGIIITLIINSFGTLNSEWAYKSCFVAQYGVTGIVAACESRSLFQCNTQPSRTLILARSLVAQSGSLCPNLLLGSCPEVGISMLLKR
jgi:hypothetical protein